MFGAIIGDIVGSRFEYIEHKDKTFNFFHEKCKFTDDTVMTIAVGKAMLECDKSYDDEKLKDIIIKNFLEVGKKYPYCGYGTFFKDWLFEDQKPKNSYGNGSAIRISPVGLFCESEGEVKRLANLFTVVSHTHEQAIKGAEATAIAVFLAKKGYFIEDIKNRIIKDYYPEINSASVNAIREENYYDCSCEKTVIQALTCFFESKNFEDAIRNAVSIGGDSDTICAVTGSVAGAYYGIPLCFKKACYNYLDKDLKNYLKQIQNKFLF